MTEQVVQDGCWQHCVHEEQRRPIDAGNTGLSTEFHHLLIQQVLKGSGKNRTRKYTIKKPKKSSINKTQHDFKCPPIKNRKNTIHYPKCLFKNTICTVHNIRFTNLGSYIIKNITPNTKYTQDPTVRPEEKNRTQLIQMFTKCSFNQSHNICHLICFLFLLKTNLSFHKNP